MKQEKFKPDTKRRANVLKHGHHFQTFLLEEVRASSKNTLSKSGEIKMWIFGICAIAVFIGLFVFAFSITK